MLKYRLLCHTNFHTIYVSRYTSTYLLGNPKLVKKYLPPTPPKFVLKIHRGSSV